MSHDFTNVYADRARADAYADLEFPGTYHLAYRDLPELIRDHVSGRRALDFGCGAGRSTRFLRGLGFDVIGIDVSEEMLAKARERDPAGDYRLVAGADLGVLPNDAFDLVLSAFTFDNVPAAEKPALLGALRARLGPRGRLVNLVSSPEIYLNEWASFSTREYPENRQAQSGDRVKIVMLDVPDRRPVEDIVCTDEAYLELYRSAGLRVLRTHHPLGRPDEPFAWKSETTIAPWVVYVLAPEVA